MPALHMIGSRQAMIAGTVITTRAHAFGASVSSAAWRAAARDQRIKEGWPRPASTCRSRSASCAGRRWQRRDGSHSTQARSRSRPHTIDLNSKSPAKVGFTIVK